MKRYADYTRPMIPWVEKIPTHWKLIRNGGLFEYHQDKVGERYNEFDLLSLSTQGIKIKSASDVKGKVPASYEGYQEVNSGDMVFCLFDLDCSAVFAGLSQKHGMITSAYDVAKPNSNIVNPKYLDYWFKSVFAGRYYKIYAKSVRYTINYDVFKAIKTPVPPYEEQDQIVRYLDWRVSKINQLIYGYQKQIKLLEERMQQQISYAVLHSTHNSEMIDSGVSFLGAIPSHWKVIQNKRLFKERTEFSKHGDEELLSISKHYGVKPQSALKNNERFATIKPAESLVGYKTVKKGDLAMNIMRARNGSYGISDYDGIVSPAYCVFEPQIACNPIFLHYFMKTPHVINMFEAYSYGIVEHRRRLYAQEFLRLYSFLPPLGEQDEIAEHISNIQSKHKILKEKLQMQIELLKEYMTRLISDVVTGQVDVRDVVIPEYTPEEYTEIDTDDTGEDMEEVAEDAE